MVYYFTSSDGHLIYMGKDKHENEDLIKYGWDEDVWFHVDDQSSAHVYLRLKDDEVWTAIPEDCINECCQLVKANSIKGCKESSVKVVYTPWNNLNKTYSMEVGAIGFKSEQEKRYVRDIQKDKEILKAMSKTLKEDYPNHYEVKESHLQDLRRLKQEQYHIQKKKDKEEELERKAEAEKRDYKNMMDPSLMRSNKENDDDDFM